MTTVLNIVLLSLAGLCLVAALYYVAKGFGARSSASRQSYNVGQVEARRAGQVYWLRAAFLFLVALIFFGVYAALPLLTSGGAASPSPTLAPTQVQATLPVPTVAVTQEPVVQPTVTSPPPTPSPEATAAPTETPAPVTATVSSGVGVWLRGAPSTTGEQLEWLLDGTIVTLMEGQQTADDLLWQQVRTEDGREGWVARNFLSVNEEPAP